MQLTAEELSGKHMGHRITIIHDGVEVTGILAGIDHATDLITDRKLCEAEPTLMAGQTTLNISVGFMPLRVAPGQRVTIHP